MTEPDVVKAMIVALLARRAPGATLCPSEVARALTDKDKGEDWRAAMPLVHAAVNDLLHDETVGLSWKGEPLNIRLGPYRISSGNDGTRQG